MKPINRTYPFNRRCFCIIFYTVTAVFQMTYGQTGPGGVGSTDGLSALKVWYNASEGVSTTGNLVDGIINRAGIADLDISESGGQRPTLVTNAVNGFAEISFSGSNRLRTGLNLSSSNFIDNQATSFVVARADNTSQRSCVYTTDPLVGSTRFTCHIPWNRSVYFDIGTCCSANARIQVNNLSNLTSYSYWSYDAHPSSGKQLYRNGNLLQSRNNTTTYNSYASQRFNIGGNTSGTNGFVGDVAEIIVFNEKVNTTQRILVENYLAAKYGLSSADNDIYVQDDNGDFDIDVAGIGQISASDMHTNSRGTGVVRVYNPNNLQDGEFLIWGHNGVALNNLNTSDKPSGATSRFERVWRVSEVNTSGSTIDVGEIDMELDLSELMPIQYNNVALLVDTDNDGNFNDESPIAQQSGVNNVFAYTQIDEITNGLRFTFAILPDAPTTIISNRRITIRVNN